jgi:biotin carboxylase
MKLLMLGGSNIQLPGIIKAKELGCKVIVCDYLENSVGHQESDKSYYVSTFDQSGVLDVARREQVDGIMTLGTDQPVLTSAFVSHQLGLPTMLSLKNAIDVTNKQYMKKNFIENTISTVEYMLYQKGINDAELSKFGSPVVIKPVDSQGQRGIYYLEEATKAIDLFDEVIQYSREKVILVERYYENSEITVSGWVDEGNTTVLSITDRVTFKDKERIGICLSHEFPSQHMEQYGKEIIELTEKIVNSFNILNGPIYFQFLIGAEGIKVNEIACRIGGAYEASFIPLLTGFDILETQIKKELGLGVDLSMLKDIKVLNNPKHISVQLFFVEPCWIESMPSEEEIVHLEGVYECGFNLHQGEQAKHIENATARGGYVILHANSQEDMKRFKQELYTVLVIKDRSGKNHIIHS